MNTRAESVPARLPGRHVEQRLRSSLAALGVALCAPASSGNPLLETTARPPAPAELQRLRSHALAVPGRYRVARLDRAGLARALRSGAPLELAPFGDVELRGRVENVEHLGGGSTFVYGLLVEGGHFHLLLHASGVVRGELHSVRGLYALESAPDDLERVTVRQLDPTRVPECATGLVPPRQDDASAGPPLRDLDRNTDRPFPHGSSRGPGLAGAARNGTGESLDVLVVFTEDAESRLGGPDHAEAWAQHAVALTNQILENSGLPDRNMALAGTAKVDYVQGSFLGHDLEVLYKKAGDACSDGRDCGDLDDVFDLRDVYKADFVHLVVPVIRGACGIASVAQGFTAEQVSEYSQLRSCRSWTDPEACGLFKVRQPGRGHAFSVSAAPCGSTTFAHELGHVLGLRHGRGRFVWANLTYG